MSCSRSVSRLGTALSLHEILRLTETNEQLPRAGNNRIEFVWESMLQWMGRESDDISYIIRFAIASRKDLSREHIEHAGSIWLRSGV